MPEAFACPNCSAPLDLSSVTEDPPVTTCRYCGSQVLLRELPAGPPVEARQVTDDWPPPRTPRIDPDAALDKVAQFARSGDRQAAVKLYRESQDSSSQEAERVIALLGLDPVIQPDWAIERVRHELRLRQSPVVRKHQPNRGNWVVYGGLFLLGLALLVPLLVILLTD